jgi:hypothetical protein
LFVFSDPDTCMQYSSLELTQHMLEFYGATVSTYKKKRGEREKTTKKKKKRKKKKSTNKGDNKEGIKDHNTAHDAHCSCQKQFDPIE